MKINDHTRYRKNLLLRMKCHRASFENIKNTFNCFLGLVAYTCNACP